MLLCAQLIEILTFFCTVWDRNEKLVERHFIARANTLYLQSAKHFAVMPDDDEAVLRPSLVKSPGGTCRSPGGTRKREPVAHPWVKVDAKIKPVQKVGGEHKSRLEILRSQAPPAKQPPPPPLQPSPLPKQQLQQQRQQSELLQPQQQHNRVCVGGRAALAAARAAELAASPAVAAFEESADYTDLPLIMSFAGVLVRPGARQRQYLFPPDTVFVDASSFKKKGSTMLYGCSLSRTLLAVGQASSILCVFPGPFPSVLTRTDDIIFLTTQCCVGPYS